MEIFLDLLTSINAILQLFCLLVLHSFISQGTPFVISQSSDVII